MGSIGLRGWLLGCAFVASLAACGGDEATAFPPGLEPLERSTAPRPTAPAGQVCPEAVATVTDVLSEYELAHGRGCIHAPIARVWEALRDPDVTVDRRRVSSWTTTRNSEPAYPVSFRVHNVVNDIITIEFDLSWRAGVIEGTDAEPRLASARYQKTFGSTYIDILAGSVALRPIDADVTEVELVRHIKSTGAGADAAEQYVRDCFASLVARVHGQPLPRYN